LIVEIQCLPTPAGTDASPYAHVEAAIAVVQGSVLKYEVSPLGTSLEGEPDAVWPVVRQPEACLQAGATSVVTIIKVAQSTRADGPTMTSLTSKFRE
jgi:uncharacterized protein YqgV (UPF0045/DUF77 family)